MIAKLLNKPIATLVFILLLSQGMYAQFPGSPTSFQREEVSDQKIQLALLLDASGSMKKYLDQAKGELWYTVNEVLSAYEGYATPQLEIAIMAYGFRKAGRRNDFIYTVVPFTTDLDWAMSELYKIVPGGSVERPIHTINQAVQELKWSYKPGDLKFIFISGNEKFAEGNWELNRMNRVKAADISINTIFAGDYFTGVKKLWKAAAIYGQGEYFALEQPNQERWRHQSGYDRDYIARLNRGLYDTYIPYGSYGNSYWDRYCYLDDYAWDYGYDSYYWRIYYKTQVNYYNPQWDLVDAIYCGYTTWDDIDDADLPTNIRELEPDRRDDYIEALWKRRQKILNDIKVYGATQAPSSTVTGSGNGSGTVGSMHQAIDRAVRKKVKSADAVLLKPVSYSAPKTPVDDVPGSGREVIRRKSSPSSTGGVGIQNQTTQSREYKPVTTPSASKRVVNISEKPVKQTASPQVNPITPRETPGVTRAPVFNPGSSPQQPKSQVGKVRTDRVLELEKQKIEKARQTQIATEAAEVERQQQIAIDREAKAREIRLRAEKERQAELKAQQAIEIERQQQIAIDRESKAREARIREEKERQIELETRREAQREVERERQQQIAHEREERARQERIETQREVERERQQQSAREREERARQERIEAQREVERERQQQIAREREERQRQERIEAQREVERERQQQIAREREDRARQERMEAQREAERARQQQASREREARAQAQRAERERQQAQQRAAERSRQEQAARQARESARRQEVQRKSEAAKPSPSKSVNRSTTKPGKIK